MIWSSQHQSWCILTQNIKTQILLYKNMGNRIKYEKIWGNKSSEGEIFSEIIDTVSSSQYYGGENTQKT